MAHFQYIRPQSLTEACQLAYKNPGYSLLAGGTDFMVKLRLQNIRPTIVIDIGDLDELRGICIEDQMICIGAAVTHTELYESMIIRKYAPALAKAASMVGSPQIRNRGTVGGNMGNASPAADTVPTLLAYGATLGITGPNENRKLAVEKLCTGPGRTTLLPGEIIREIYIPMQQSNQGSNFQKLGKRKALAISVVNAAAWIELANDKKITAVRLALGSVAATAIRLYEAEEKLLGKRISDDLIREISLSVRETIHPIDDVRSKATYRKNIANILIKRALEDAWKNVRDII